MTATPVLRVTDLSVGYAERVVLRDLTFEVPGAGVAAVLGPSGVGKSTLMRTLARLNEPLPAFWRRGTVRVDGVDLFALDEESLPRRVALLAQKSRLYTASVCENLIASSNVEGWAASDKRRRAEEILAEMGLSPDLEGRLQERAVDLPLGLQRCLSLARIAAGGARVLLVDEPTRDIPADEAARLEALLVHLRTRAAILLVTHDQALARRLADRVLFIVAGRAQEWEDGRRFFRSPGDPKVQRFLEQGNCWIDDPAEEPAPQPTSAAAPPGFHWIIKGQLGGTPRPGLLGEEQDELAALAGLGVQVLVTLEEAAFPAAKLSPWGIRDVHLPIPDMGAPTTVAAHDLCAAIRDFRQSGAPVVIHCKGGLGRTGTLLAAYLIYEGQSALHALDQVRAVCPRYVQSQVQLDFLASFERACRAQEKSVGPGLRVTP